MGATIHLHYCMGKLTSWGLINHENKNCEGCGMLKNKTASHSMSAKTDCCRDEHMQIKTDKDQKLFPSEFFKYNYLSPTIALNDNSVQSTKAVSISAEYPNTNAPPLSDKLPLFILYRNFRL